MAPQSSARLSLARAGARDPARLPPDHLCGLGYSPADARQSAAENNVCRHAERMLNMVRAYREIRDSWIGWLRGSAMSRTLHQRIVPEMRDLQRAERRVVDKPSVTLLAVLDYAARAREAVPEYTPLTKIDYPQLPMPDAMREACERMQAEAADAARGARRVAAREYAARMAHAIAREREEEARRQRAMAEHGVTATPEQAKATAADLEARIAVYQRERTRALAEAETEPDSKPDGACAQEEARTRTILDAMRGWTGRRLKRGRHRGAPYVRALRKTMGLRDITRAERNRLWRIVAPEGARQKEPEGARRNEPEGARRNEPAGAGA